MYVVIKKGVTAIADRPDITEWPSYRYSPPNAFANADLFVISTEEPLCGPKWGNLLKQASGIAGFN